ncbi:MAG: carbon starvation protein A [Muribaculaceae bacterium]|nr:carbon starvation protein A [Muribaculaceae bacterium]
MTAFLTSIFVLIAGYFIYGAIAERIFGIDPSRPTPAIDHADGVDFVPLPTWKVFLIQFLNIAGLGPIFGAIMGIMFGPAAFLWIVIGTIFGGAVHDFFSAMVSLRNGGVSLPEIVGNELGRHIRAIMSVFSVILLVLVAAVFVVSPSGIIADMFAPGSQWADTTLWVGIIFAYYMLATMLPIDKLIGRFYPIFGFALLFMAVGILGVLLFGNVGIPDGFSDGLHNRRPDAESAPLFPMMFISIACGAISGFHATQSPMMARCLKNERLARPVFYGAMVAEGIVALIWAAAAIAFTGGYEGLSAYMAEGKSAASLVHDISIGWLGIAGGILAIVGVVAAPITTGDTALRSARLMLADMFGFDQKPIFKRLLICIPLFAVTMAVTVQAMNPKQFEVVWRYFAWSNQTLAVFTLWAMTVYLARHSRFYGITLVPAMFMTVVSVTFLLVAPKSQGGLELLSGNLYPLGLGSGIAVALAFCALFYMKIKHLKNPVIDNA